MNNLFLSDSILFCDIIPGKILRNIYSLQIGNQTIQVQLSEPVSFIGVTY